MIGLIGWGRYKEADGTRSANPAGLWKVLENNAAAIADSFDFVQAPPDSLAQGGSGAGCDGYEVFEYRQKNGTRYETVAGSGKEELMAASAALAAHNVELWGDLSAHQMGGENGGPGVFTYGGRRGATKPSWFQCYGQPGETMPPFSPKDSIPSLQGAYPFGRVRSYEHSPESKADIKDVLNDEVHGIGYKGMRWDDTKATNAGSVCDIMNSQPGLPFVGEYDDGNAQNIQGWATSAPMNSRSGAEDFTLHYRLQAACNGFNAALFDQGGWGFAEINPGLGFGFVDNPDTDSTDGQQVIFNKGIAYALMLNLPMRAAMVYGKDYWGSNIIKGGYGLKPLIDNLCWISRTFAFGKFERRWVDSDVYAFTRDGNGGAVGWSGGLLVAVNFNTGSARTITVQTMWAPGTKLQNYSATGQQEIVYVGPGGMVTITLQSNANSGGRSYGCYAPAGVTYTFPMPTRSIRQTFFGAGDLLTKAAVNTPAALPQRLYAAKGTRITPLMRTIPAKGTVLGVAIYGPDGVQVTGQVTETGWHTIKVGGFNLPEGGIPFELDVTYTYPRGE